MRVFTIYGDDDWGALKPDRHLGSLWLSDQIENSPLAASWREQPLRRYRDGPLGNMPHMSNGFLLVTQGILEAVDALVSDFGEWLPARFDGEVLMIFNCLETIDAIDADASAWFHDREGGWSAVMEPAFHPSRLTVPIFRTPESSELFVRDDLVDALLDVGATGSRVSEAWSSEPSAPRCRSNRDDRV